MSFLTRKSFESIKELGKTSGLNKTLGAFDLVLLGLGAIIGTGVFVTTGIVAAKYSGPAVTLSYAIAGVTCIFVALAYTELATMLPTSGSVYTYAYVAFGEVFAWLIGSVIILELGFAAGTVAAGWSGYAQAILSAGGIYLPKALTAVPANGGIINLPAFLIVVFISFILYLGTKDSKKLNALLVFVKMAAIFAFIIYAAPHFNATNWQNFLPFGFSNMLVGASILFFAMTGFGTIAATAEECKNPNRDLMIGIIGSLVISTIVYVIIAGLATSIASFDQLNNDQPLAYALSLNNSNVGSAIVATGAVAGMTTVLMMNIYGTSRIFYVIARDGLLPKSFAKLHTKYDSPYITILLFSALAAILGGFCPTEILIQLSSMGALIDYTAVAIIVMLFRIKMPDATRPFKCPAAFIIIPFVLVACLYLLVIQIVDGEFNLMTAGKVLIYWFVAMFVLYIFRSFFIKREV
ncbi:MULTISPECIES: amino acid permease [unclassified Candidatus Tisiphia]|jgi:APA family basic amino acid/polyamine antiporter|uniref:amino acid permease n=1 Tax=unclassified Candidatus Tisiphia TaxID=2996318 RepID=UPI002829E14C|nr:amino acid permease [Rickettsia sp.]